MGTHARARFIRPLVCKRIYDTEQSILFYIIFNCFNEKTTLESSKAGIYIG